MSTLAEPANVSEVIASDDVSLTLQLTAAVPEPSSVILLGTGLAGLCTTLRRRLRIG